MGGAYRQISTDFFLNICNKYNEWKQNNPLWLKHKRVDSLLSDGCVCEFPHNYNIYTVLQPW